MREDTGVATMKQSEIEQGLRNLGLDMGDIVLLHSSLRSFGHVEGGAQAVVDAFLELLGEHGTLVVPTFGPLGILTEVVREHPRAVRSIHPMASVAAIGPQAEAICKDHWKAATAHGHDTPYTRIAELGGWVCLAGVDQDRSTTLHTVEALLQLPYLSDRTRTFPAENGEDITATWRFFPGPHRDFIALDRLLREKAAMRTGRIGNSVVRLMKSQDLLDACIEAGRVNPALVLCDNPACADCVGQRAAIRRDRFAKESFSLTASSGLAGRYVPEMVENLHACGINAVELDLVQGRPVQALPEGDLRDAIQELHDSDCRVTALRCPAAPDSPADLMDAATDNGILRIVLPLCSATEEHAVAAAERGLHLSVVNTVQGSEMTTSMLLALQAHGHEVGLVLNAANFARAGENPFLCSYKRKLHRFLDQLDLEDSLFDGTGRPLARGNAEIKELISILRCASFSGPMTLTKGNRQVGNLLDAVERLEALLDAM